MYLVGKSNGAVWSGKGTPPGITPPDMSGLRAVTWERILTYIPRVRLREKSDGTRNLVWLSANAVVIRRGLMDSGWPPRGAVQGRPRELRWSMVLAHQPSPFRKSTPDVGASASAPASATAFLRPSSSGPSARRNDSLAARACLGHFGKRVTLSSPGLG